MNYCEALDHPDLFGRWFGGESWAPWRTIEKAIFGLPLKAGELPLFRELTGRDQAPDHPATEVWIGAGRRSAKSRKGATVGTYLATIGAEVLGYRQKLAPGERGVVLVLAVDKIQARVTLDYARAYFAEIPMFRRMVERDTGEGLDLSNKMSLVVAANDFRSVRGRTVVAAIFDEIAYWRSDYSANPDLEVYRAIKPALASMPNSLLIGIGSPYRRAGLLWQKFRKNWARPGDVLVIRAPTITLNPTIDRAVIAEALEDDPEAAAAEWQAEFRSDLADFVSREVVESLVEVGCHERRAPPPVGGHSYRAFTDPSGGSSDSFTLAIAHREGEAAVLDLVREVRAPFAPEAVVAEFATVLKSYRLSTVTGDKYAGEWPREQFSKRGITYEASSRTKSEIYLEALPLLNGGRLDLLDNQRLVSQICGLERRVTRGGRESVDHAPLAHDDMANAALGAAVMCCRREVRPSYGFARIVIGSAGGSREDARERFWAQMEGRA
jgi:hypothetical protein